MYDQIYFTKTRYDESRRLEEFGLSQPLAERLVLSYEFEEEETYKYLETIILHIKEYVSDTSETGKNRLNQIKNQLGSKNISSNKKALIFLGLTPDKADEFATISFLFQRVIKELS